MSKDTEELQKDCLNPTQPFTSKARAENNKAGTLAGL